MSAAPKDASGQPTDTGARPAPQPAPERPSTPIDFPEFTTVKKSDDSPKERR